MQTYLVTQGSLCVIVSDSMYIELPVIIQAALVIICLALFIILATLGAVYYNRAKTYVYRRTIRKAENIILDELNEHMFKYDDVNEMPDEELTLTVSKLERLKQRSPVFKDTLMKVLVMFRHNLSGALARVISATYTKLRLAEITQRKLRSKPWFYKTEGLNEVLEMKDQNALSEVRKLKKDDNIDVRIAAYATLIELQSNDLFDFLETETSPLSEWHQIFLLDTIDKAKPASIPDFSKYLGSQNDSIVLLSLKLIMHFKQFTSVAAIVALLRHRNDRVRNHAICAVGSLNAEMAEKDLIEIYPKENNKNKAEILLALGDIASGNSIEFLREKFLKADHYTLLKNAVLAITKHAVEWKDKALKNLPQLDAEQKAMLVHFKEPLNQYGIN